MMVKYKFVLDTQLFGGRGDSSGGGSGGYTNSNGFFQTLTGVNNYSRQDLTSAADKAPFKKYGEGKWRIGVSAGPEHATATNYGIAASVEVHGPKSPINSTSNVEQGKYRVLGQYYDKSFDTFASAKNAARTQLKKELGDAYDLRTKNKAISKAKSKK